MSNDTPLTQASRGAVSRRSIALGAAWAVPAIAVAGVAPAFAASAGCCYTLDWNQFSRGADANQQVATLTADRTCANQTPLTARMSLSRGGNPGAVPTSGTSCSTGLYSSAFNGRVDFRGEQMGYPQSSPFRLPALSDTERALILNIGHNTTTSVTFTFSAPVAGITFNLYDLTRSNSTQSSGAYRYTDEVSFSRPTALGGSVTSLNSTAQPAGSFYSRTAQLESNASNPQINTVTTTDADSSSTFTITYRAQASCGWQFVGIGDMRVCLPTG